MSEQSDGRGKQMVYTKMINIIKYITSACSTIEIEYQRELYNMTK